MSTQNRLTIVEIQKKSLRDPCEIITTMKRPEDVNFLKDLILCNTRWQSARKYEIHKLSPYVKYIHTQDTRNKLVRWNPSKIQTVGVINSRKFILRFDYKQNTPIISRWWILLQGRSKNIQIHIDPNAFNLDWLRVTQGIQMYSK